MPCSSGNQGSGLISRGGPAAEVAAVSLLANTRSVKSQVPSPRFVASTGCRGRLLCREHPPELGAASDAVFARYVRRSCSSANRVAPARVCTPVFW